MQNEEHVQATANMEEAAIRIRSLRGYIAQLKEAGGALRQRRDMVEAQQVSLGLEGKNETERKAALTVALNADPVWLDTLVSIRQNDREIDDGEAEVELWEHRFRIYRAMVEQITAETLAAAR